jgi:hypothetical protein
MAKGIGGHTLPNQGRTNDWITPQYLLQALGEFDLDPCECLQQPWPCARQGYNINDNGLNQKWFGRPFCNPPYGDEAWPFLERMGEHGRGISLVFARTETKMFQTHVWQNADAILFLAGRLHFYYPDPQQPGRCQSEKDHLWSGRPESPKTKWCPLCGKAKGNSGGPSILIAYGEADVEALRNSGLPGALVVGWQLQNMKIKRTGRG